jgi:hypothetical protein
MCFFEQKAFYHASAGGLSDYQGAAPTEARRRSFLIMSTSAIISAMSFVLAAVPAFVRLADIPMDARIFVVLLLGSIGFAASTAFLGRRRQSPKIAGILRVTHPEPSLLPRRLFAVALILALGLLAAVASMLVWVTVIYHNVRVSTSVSISSEQLLVFVAPRVVTQKVVISLPPSIARSCKPWDPLPTHKPKTLMSGWGSANPLLEITNFKHPEHQGLRCSAAVGKTEITIRMDPPTVLALWPEDLCFYEILTLIYGGVLWLIGLFYVFWRRLRA